MKLIDRNKKSSHKKLCDSPRLALDRLLIMECPVGRRTKRKTNLYLHVKDYKTWGKGKLYTCNSKVIY